MINPRLRRLVTILAVALALRVALPIASWLANGDTSRFHANDTGSYLAPAAQLLSTGTFTREGRPEIIRTPGYPLLLVVGLLLGQVEWVTVFVQVVLGTLSVFLTYRLAWSVTGDESAALLSAALLAVAPLSSLYCGILLTESLFTTMLLASLWLLLRHLREGNPAYLLLSAAALASSAYVRPISYPLAAVVALAMLHPTVAPERLWTRCRRALVFAITAALMVLPWQLRNGAKTGFYGLSAISAISLYFYQGASVRAAEEGVPFYRMQQEMGHADPDGYFRIHPDQAGWSAGQRYAYLQGQGVGLIAEHPLTYTAIHLKGVVRTLIEPGAVDLLKYLGAYPRSGGLLGVAIDRGIPAALIEVAADHPAVFWTSVLLGLLLLAVYILAAVGVWRLPPGPPKLLLLLTIFYFALLSGGPQGLGRFRIPIAPAIAVFAGVGAAAALRASGRGRSPSRDSKGLSVDE